MKRLLLLALFAIGCGSSVKPIAPLPKSESTAEIVKKRTPLHTKWAEFSVQSDWSWDFAESTEDAVQFATNDPDGKVLILLINNPEWDEDLDSFIKIAIAKAFNAGGSVDELNKTKIANTDAATLLVSKGTLKVRYFAAVKNNILHVIVCSSPKEEFVKSMTNECNKFVETYKMH